MVIAHKVTKKFLPLRSFMALTLLIIDQIATCEQKLEGAWTAKHADYNKMQRTKQFYCNIVSES